MNGLNKSIIKKSENNAADAWSLVKNGITILEASTILMHLINITMKNYSAIASNFAVFGKSIISKAQPNIHSISRSQYYEIIAFLDLSKKVSGSFSIMTLTIVDAVGQTRFMNDPFSKSLETVNLLLLEKKFFKIFVELSGYKGKISNLDYSSIYNSLTSMMEEHTRHLMAGRNAIRAAEEILGAALSAQRTLECAILAHS